MWSGVDSPLRAKMPRGYGSLARTGLRLRRPLPRRPKWFRGEASGVQIAPNLDFEGFQFLARLELSH